MTTTVTRLYDYPADAFRTVSELKLAGLTGQDIRLVAGPEPGMDLESSAQSGDVPGAGAPVANAHAPVVKPGGTIMTVHLPAGRETEIKRILDRYPAIDPDRPDDL